MEAAGLVVGITLPFLIEAVVANKDNLKLFRKAARSKVSDDVLLDFCHKFWEQTDLFYRLLRRLIERLPNISQERKDQVKESRNLETWKNEDIASSLRQVFGDEDHDSFQRSLFNVGRMLWRLTSEFRAADVMPENSTSPFMLQQPSAEILRQLEALDKDMRSEPNRRSWSSWKRNYRVLKNEKSLENSLLNLKGRVEHLEKIIAPVIASNKLQIRPLETTITPPAAHDTASRQPTGSRRLSKLLFTAMCKTWANCPCKNRHEARFSLFSCCGEMSHLEEMISFDFFISQSKSPWREVSVQATKKRSELFQDAERFDGGICNALANGSPDHRVNLLVEDNTVPLGNASLQIGIAPRPNSTLWQLHLGDVEMVGWDKDNATTFQLLLETKTPCPEPTIREKLRLAVTIAHSVLQLHESPWLSEQWDKNRIHFFCSSNSGKRELHWSKPYMSASFGGFDNKALETNILNIYHRNPGILKLGILLMEIHKWKSIEPSDSLPLDCAPLTKAERLKRVEVCFQSAQEAFNERDMEAGCSPTYRKVIENCIWVGWLAMAGARVSLENAEIWTKVYENIVKPLEDLLACSERPMGFQG